MAEETPKCTKDDSPKAVALSNGFARMIQQFAQLTQTDDNTMIALCADIIFRLHVVGSAVEYTDEKLLEYLAATLKHYRTAWETRDKEEQSVH